MKAAEVFSKISRHQIEGVMLHDQMADAFAFLALPGFEKLHEHQYKEESAGMRNTHRYYISRVGMLMCEGRPEDPQVIPRSWMGYKRRQVSAENKRKAVSDLMDHWVRWEQETKQMYEECCRHLTECNEIAAACFVKQMVMDVDEELCHAEKLQLRLESVSYDMAAVDQIQHELMEMYGE